MSYGIEVYNSAGRLVFTSERKTLRVQDQGTVTLSSATDSVPVPFAPTEEMPEIFLGNPGYYTAVPQGTVRTLVRRAMVGAIEKNAQGLYYRFHVVMATSHYLPPGVSVGGQEPFPWTIPWIVFI